MTLDFSGQNLRGRSFKGRTDLIGANFSYADIRGTDFTNARLQEANFSQTQAGREPNWAMVLLAVALLLSALSGVGSAFVGFVIANTLLRQDSMQLIAGVSILITLAALIGVSMRQGLVAAFGVWFVMGVTLIAILSVFGVGAAIAIAVIAIAGVIVLALVAAAASISAGSGATVVVAGAAAAAAGISVASNAAGTTAITGTIAAALAVAVAMAASGLSASVTWKALAGDKKYALIQNLIISFAILGGTNFQGADLTEADFTQATLESTNFKQAKLIRTCWFQAQKLSWARVSNTYLENVQVQKLVITGEGNQQNFDHFYLRGVNLRGANLVEASFVGAELSEANLQSANLSQAKLIQTHLDGADLTGARLIGACIEDWAITNATKFDKVQYEYVFKRLGQKRRPKPEPPRKI